MATYADLGSISSATHRLADLIPAYVSALDTLKEKLSLNAKGNELETTQHVGHIDRLLAQIEERTNQTGDPDDYYESEDAHEDLEELAQQLEWFAPPGAHFGANEGDGADFGFWVSQDALEALKEDEEVAVVSDTSEALEKYPNSPLVLLVNDHGNVTLYEQVQGTFTEIWSIV